MTTSKDTAPVPMSREVADEVGRALTRKYHAEAASFEKDVELEERRLRSLELSLKRDEMDMFKREVDFKAYMASDHFHHVYYFGESVDSKSVEKCMSTLDLWDRTEPGCEITIVFNSPGGTIFDGLAMFDHIQFIKRQGHKVVTLAEGMAASMAGILLQAGTTRVITREAWVLIHQVQASMMGNWGQIEDRMKLLNRVQQRVLEIYADRAREAGEVGTASEPLPKEEFAKRWERTDWWIPSGECLKWGIVDEVR